MGLRARRSNLHDICVGIDNKHGNGNGDGNACLNLHGNAIEGFQLYFINFNLHSNLLSFKHYKATYTYIVYLLPGLRECLTEFTFTVKYRKCFSILWQTPNIDKWINDKIYGKK